MDINKLVFVIYIEVHNDIKYVKNKFISLIAFVRSSIKIIIQ